MTSGVASGVASGSGTRPAGVARMREFGTSIFAEMSALAVATGAINLGQGFPDTDGPAEVLDAARAAIAGGANQYPPGPGIPELREAIAAHQRHWYGLEYDPSDEVLVTAGATEAIASAVLGLVEPGEHVVVFEPYYDSYTACIALAGAHRRVVTLRRGDAGWTFDPDDLRRAAAGARAVLLNSPHNPTGTVFSAAQLAEVAAVAREFDLLVISDEVYEHLTFDAPHVPIATLPGMRERTVRISSAGKTFSVTGWKIGWASAPAPLLAGVRRVKQFLTYVNGAPFQPAVAAGLALPDERLLAAGADLRVQRDLLCDGLAERGWDVVRPQATYFATVDVGSDGVEFCRELPLRAGVVAIPSSVFYDSDAGARYVRFAFCKRPAVLTAALERLGSPS